jgi:prevent-host-death family protein
MVRQYSIAEARDRLPAIVHDAEQGDPVQITRRGRPVAVLVSVADFERLTAAKPNFWELVVAFRKRHDLAELDVDDVFRDVRDRSPGRDFDW